MHLKCDLPTIDPATTDVISGTVTEGCGVKREPFKLDFTLYNNQPAEKRVERNDGALEVVDVFATIQGEGPYAGTPAVFVRLAGCILQCPLCDTNYTSGRELLPIEVLLNKVDAVAGWEWDEEGDDTFRVPDNSRARPIELVVITGGEPLRQSCGPFVRMLISRGYRPQIETNGMVNDRTLSEETAISDFTVVCSPKGSVHKDLRANIDALKYVVKAGMIDESDGLPTRALDLDLQPERPWKGFDGEVYVQPCDEQDEEKNRLNMEAAVKSCMEFGYTLGIQIHKIARLP